MDVFDEIAAEMEANGEQPGCARKPLHGRCGTDTYEVTSRAASWWLQRMDAEDTFDLEEAA